MSVTIKEPQQKPQACVIWMHGLGADASDMEGVAEQLTLGDIPVRHLFLNAPSRPVTVNGGMVMPAWYDILGMQLVDREDKEGIEQSEQLIRNVLDAQIKDGFSSQQIYLAGFSQGGAMALHTGLHTTERLGGVIALSAYIPLARQTQPVLDKKTSVFMGSGQFDPLVLPTWSQYSKEWLLSKGYEDIVFRQYPMEHSICMEEIDDLSLWLVKKIAGGTL